MSKQIKIQFILGSTRDGRSGEKIFNWLKEQVSKNKGFKAEAEFIDLKEWDLPFLKDAVSPSMGKYSDPLVIKWSEKIDSADGYVFITPEYNHGYSAVLKNALDLIYKEWNNKPLAFVSYGGISGGTRAVQQLKQVVIELQMFPIRNAVAIPMIWQAFDEKGQLKNVESYNQSLQPMLENIVYYSSVLKEARSKKK